MKTAAERILALLTPRERRRGALVLLLMLFLALLETAGVASVMPFLAVLGNPEMVRTNATLAWLYEAGGFPSVDAFLFALGGAAFLLIMASAVVRIIATYAVQRFTHMRRYSLAVRLLHIYLRQPYEFFLNRNSADLAKSILSEVDAAVTNVVKPVMDVISYGLITVVLIGLLVVVDPLLALIVTIFVGGAYGGIYLRLGRFLSRIGGDRLVANNERFTAASEAFGGIKDLKVLGREQAYMSRFRGPAERFASHLATSATLSAAPRYLIEAIGFGGILVLALGLMATREDLGEALPLLGLYAFAAYRLLPAAQHIYKATSMLRFGMPAVEAVYDDLVRTAAGCVPDHGNPPPLRLGTDIRFEAVDFRYAGAEHPALENVTLRIAARTTVGIVGRTGAGKTTAVDLILGLLRPTRGQILVDGQPLTEAVVARWQRAIGYVPQTIYLADVSVAENIAFGIPAAEIDREAVERASRVASIHDFITTEMPAGYDTVVGERGVRLSGGQRQRIGIARALYHDPALLVMDEATNALDPATEHAIMDAVHRLSGEKTIVMIAHRLTTVKDCDRIVVLEGGRVQGAGSFEEMRSTNAAFRAVGGVVA